ncbi:MAG: DUF4350 domain-containing protein [Armatimonadetes bacterium]|nr:DUF4350 domain-containing protein [Armatimonadota bacterium]
MKVPREVWWIVGLTAVAVVLATLLGGTKTADDAEGLLPNRTTYSSSPAGLRGLYLTLGRLGYHEERLRRPLTSANLPREGTLFVVAPIQPPELSNRELDALRNWVAAGNTLLLAGEEAVPSLVSIGPEEQDLPPLFAEPEWTEAEPTQPVYLTSGVRRLAVRSTFRIKLRERDTSSQSHEHDDAFSFDDEQNSELATDLVAAAPILGDEYGFVGAYAQVGEGRVVLLASPWSLSNEGLDKADNFAFVLNVVGSPSSAPVYFDEYHHGYAENVAWAFMPRVVKLGLAQIVLGLLVVVFARSRRLGPVVPLERGGRQRSEFLGTMTTVLRKGHATRLAVRTACEATVEKLKLEVGAASDATDETLVRAVSRVNSTGAERLRAALAQTRSALATETAPTETRAMELLRLLDEAAAEARRI